MSLLNRHGVVSVYVTENDTPVVVGGAITSFIVTPNYVIYWDTVLSCFLGNVQFYFLAVSGWRLLLVAHPLRSVVCKLSSDCLAMRLGAYNRLCLHL